MSTVVLDVLVGIAIALGVMGIVVPVLPGSAVILGALLVWAALTGGAAWWLAAVAAVIIAVGQLLKYLLPGRSLAGSGIPGRSIMVGGLAGIIGFLMIPFVGMVIGFVAGVYVAEHLRLGTVERARASTWVALRATGLSLLIELAAAMLAASVWAIGLAARTWGA